MSTLPVRKKPGAPSKRTEQRAAMVCKCVAKGLPFNQAAAIAGISSAHLCAWRSAVPSFEERIQRAIARGVKRRLDKIEAASRGDWRAAAWLLEHCQPEYFSKSRIEVSGPNGAPLAGVVAIVLPPKQDGNGSPVITVPALTEGRHNGNGN
jgi:hypothetical protein